MDIEALRISFNINNVTGKVDFTISVNENEAKSIEDIVIANKKSDEVISFWEKVLELERFFGVKFIPDKEVTIELLNSVEGRPYKKYETYENVSLSGCWNF
ncbi:hypothetical protein [Anaerosacchariphilus polymeriproducens]|uniref:hypothetical protein n=1 Tax=Anaerosacchariphilus polymeriproducens TaxID=1812858 RepID=UPI00139028FB|nr:hypothetical protein [Anaerosacchariphilus polymeriproducens]